MPGEKWVSSSFHVSTEKIEVALRADGYVVMRTQDAVLIMRRESFDDFISGANSGEFEDLPRPGTR